jgi:hypothetical protein
MTADAIIALLNEVAEFIEPYEDVKDGSDGPRPNKAMTLRQDVDDAIYQLRKTSAPQVIGAARPDGGHAEADRGQFLSATSANSPALSPAAAEARREYVHSGWIPCGERMPGKYLTVLAAFDHTQTTGYWTGHRWYLDIQHPSDPLLIPSHWRPLEVGPNGPAAEIEAARSCEGEGTK